MSSAAREVVILVDQSYSMGFGDHWTRARTAAREAVEALAPDDRATVIFFARGARAGARSTVNRASLLASITAAEVSAQVTRYGPALKLAQTILEASELARSEVIMISDFQKRGWDASEGARFPDGTVPDADVSRRSDGRQRRRLGGLVRAGVLLRARAGLRVGAARQYR